VFCLGLSFFELLSSSEVSSVDELSMENESNLSSGRRKDELGRRFGATRRLLRMRV
jgi:hypothetical protein